MSARAEVKAILEAEGLRAKKALGQNFLIDEAALMAIAYAATDGGPSAVIEIGPGPGTLTRRLLDRFEGHLTVIERDRGFAGLLRADEALKTRLTVIEADVLEVDLSALHPGCRPHVVGNLPYNISTPILLKLLAARDKLGPATLMLQREVADRLMSPPGQKAYGSLSVLFQMHAELFKVRKVPPQAFKPAPKVHSTVIQLAWRSAPQFSLPAGFETAIRAAFSQRRKQLKNSLAKHYDEAAIKRAEAVIDLKRRAESLALNEFAELSWALEPEPGRDEGL